MMRASPVMVLIALGGCGRVGFEASDDGGVTGIRTRGTTSRFRYVIVIR
jgi:hypothetical protein